MFAFRLCPHSSGGSPVTSLAVLGGHFFPNCLFLGGTWVVIALLG